MNQRITIQYNEKVVEISGNAKELLPLTKLMFHIQQGGTIYRMKVDSIGEADGITIKQVTEQNKQEQGDSNRVELSLDDVFDGKPSDVLEDE